MADAAQHYTATNINEVRLVEWVWCCFQVLLNLLQYYRARELLTTQVPWMDRDVWGWKQSLCRDPWLPLPHACVLPSPRLSSITSASYNLASTLHTPLPPSALHAFTLNILSPYPQKNSDNSGGKFIRSKNKHVSVSVLLPWHIPQGCGALWMALSVHFVWGSIHTSSAHTPHHTQKRYFQRMLKKQLSPLFCSFVITVTPQANLALVSSCREKPSSYKVPSLIT